MARSTRLTVIALALGLLAGCVGPNLPETPQVSAPEAIRVRANGRIVRVPIEDYVLGSTLSEVSPVRETPAAVARIFDVQAILSRTYAVSRLGRHRPEGFDLCDTTHCQLYEPGRIATSRFAEAAREAVGRTRGVILVFSERPAEALYHSDCGGHTASADLVWGGPSVPYLTGAPDAVPSLTHRKWLFEAALDRVEVALNLDARSRVGRRLNSIRVLKRDPSGRAAEIEIRGERTLVVRGEEFRAILNRTLGDRALLSTRLAIERSGASYRFTGTGFGHGVGLCQAGAAARAARGESPELILAAYFPGARPQRARPIASRLGGNLLGMEGSRLLKSP
jgi:stage II sporulation protein D (peptidoglycan lytic transglycosylase)